MNKIILILLLLPASLAFAQQVKVFSSSDMHPVGNCLIYNEKQNKSAVTDDNGLADVSKFDPAETLIFSHIAFVQTAATKSSLAKAQYTILLTPAFINLKEVVLSANKVEENHDDLSNRIDIIASRQIYTGNPQTSADLLQQSGNVFVQQSQLGGGSPVIRGMETNRVLMVVDGVRMNNAIYRAGHLQNVITIDPNMLQRVEIVHGPGSVIYGSDAMGGVMHFYTKDPVLSATGKVYTAGNAMLRYSSAASEFTQSFSLNAGGKKVAALVGATNKHIGDLREGSRRSSKYGDWGKCLYYADRVDGKDVMTANSDPLVQRPSGYSQYDLFSKMLWKPDNSHTVKLNAQFSNSGNIPRYDRLSEMTAGKLKYAEWYYGPQTRALVSASSEWLSKTSMYDRAEVTAAYQYVSEDRISRSFGKTKKKHQEETVGIVTLNADFMKKIAGVSELRYGLEGTSNKVTSKAYNENIVTGLITYDAATRYPDGGGKMGSLAVYASNNWEINSKLIFSQGVRFNYVKLNAEYTAEMMALIKFPFAPAIEQDNTAVNGSLGLVFQPGGGWRAAANLSTGFRAPNIDDLTKLNDSNSTDRLIIVPNPSLKPENSYNAEFTLEKAVSNRFKASITGYYTLLEDAFIVKSSKYNGNDSILFDGSLSAVQSMQNASSAYIYGIEASASLKLLPALSLSSSLTYTYGRVSESNAPLDHIPPLFGITSLQFEKNKFSCDLYARYNGWKHIEDYSPSGEDNEAYATADGMPAWYTANLKAGYRFSRYIGLQAGIENILDTHYRYFASGISAPGRNVYVTLRANF